MTSVLLATMELEHPSPPIQDLHATVPSDRHEKRGKDGKDERQRMVLNCLLTAWAARPIKTSREPGGTTVAFEIAMRG